MPSYKDYIIPTISLFFRHKNEIDIFIEDSNDEEFYKSLFQKLLERKRVTKIISCGCKTKLIKACESDQVDRQRNRIYIADGDLDLIFDNNRKDLKHLHIFDKYCIENFLLEEEAIIEILHDIIICDRDNLKKQLGYTNWLKNISNSLIELFLHYSILHQLKTGSKTVSNNVGTYCKQVKGVNVLNISRVEDEIKIIRNEILTHIDEDKFDEIIYDRRQTWPSNISTLITIVSGKDYLLPLLAFRFKKLKGKETYNLKYEALRMRLVKTCKFETLNELKKRIISA